MRQISFLSWALVGFLVAFNLKGCAGYRALFVFLLPAKSHFTTFSVLAEELARRGNDVTVVTFFPKDNAIYRQIVLDIEPFDRQTESLNITQWRKMNPFLASFFMSSTFPIWLENSLRSEEFKTLIHSNERYDVILGEVGNLQSIVTALGHKFNAPVIDICPLVPLTYTTSILGNPHSFSYVPNVMLVLGDRMTFLERVYNTIFSVWAMAGEYLYLLPAQDALMRKHFTYPGAENLPPIREMMRNVSISLVNAHFSINYPRPLSPNMIEVGGLHLKPVKKLPQDLQKFMDEAQNGVVYFSFGTVVKDYMLSVERIQSIVSTLKRLKQKVIFKWSDPMPFQEAKNVLVLSFAPQQEILAHPNCVLFVTHGGYNSLIEVTRAGVPILGIPVFADQFRNIHYYEETGIGKGLDLDNFNSDELYQTINNIIETPSFRENAKETSRRTQDRPLSALETAIFWVDYVVRHQGAHHLKPSAVYLPYYQYLLFDVLGVLLLVIFITYKLIRKLCCSKSKFKASNVENTKKNK